MRIALIPARGGSKRIPRKNIKPFCGKPIIAYSIQAAKDAGCFDHIIVSTDDDEIAEVAHKEGADIPFIRPEEFSNDYATTMDVIRHTLGWYENNNVNISAICCLYATAPFITAQDLRKGFDILQSEECAFTFSATSYAFPVQRAFYLNDQHSIQMFQPKHLETRSQDLVEAYHDAGQFYWCRAEAVRKNLPIFAAHSKPVLLDRSRVQDIDTPEDWTFAQFLYKVMTQK